MSNYRYSRISGINEIKLEKYRLQKKCRSQERKLSREWDQIEDSWRFVGKITGFVSNLFSSASMLGSVDLGYKLISHFFSRKKRKKQGATNHTTKN